jgi:hypothetical protein
MAGTKSKYNHTTNYISKLKIKITVLGRMYNERGMQDFQYFSSLPVLNYLQVVLFIQI